MPVSEKKRITNDRYNSKCDAIMLRPLKPIGDRIRQAAIDSGKSLQGFILDAIDEQIKRDQDGENIPQEIITKLIEWLREKGHSDEEIIDCIKRLTKE